MIIKRLATFAASAACLALAGAPIAVQAQDAATASAPEANPLNLPANPQMLGTRDPNLRTATAVVNGSVITGTDIDHRVALVVAASDGQIADSELARLRMQVLRNLIDETLQIQAAKAQEIEVPQADIDQTYARVAAQNFGQDVAAMDAHLRSIGSSPASLKRQIEGELSWQRLLRRNIQPFVNVSEDEVRELLQRLEASRGQEEYRLGEIYLSATAENAAQVQQNAQRIIEQLRQGGSFIAYARQFSEASTAAVGGDLGFVRPAQLPSELAVAAQSMQPGQVVGPIAIPGGFSILYMIDRRQVLTADPRDAVLSLKQISISFEPGMTEAQAQGRVRQFSQMVQSIRGCGDVERAAATMGAQVVANDELRARSLPEQLQAAMLQLQIGQTTPAFGSVEDGVRVLMLCGRDDPEQSAGPSFDALMQQLEEDRVNKRAQRYLRDLRNDAIIEYN